MPQRKPMAAGTTENLPMSSHIFIEGISKDHTEAAIITPEANPNNSFCVLTGMASFMKNTKEDPISVPEKGSNKLSANSPIYICIYINKLVKWYFLMQI